MRHAYLVLLLPFASSTTLQGSTTAAQLMSGQFVATSTFTEDHSSAPTWCTYATCNPSLPTHMPWNHGTSTIDRTCGAETLVDTADVTVWSYHVGADTDGDVTENRVPGTPEQMILSVTTNDVYRNVLRTANLAVTQQRLRTVLTFPLQNARAKISIAGGQGVVDHRVYYEIVMYQSANPPPTLPGRNNSFNVACVVQGFNPLCTSVAKASETGDDHVSEVRYRSM